MRLRRGCSDVLGQNSLRGVPGVIWIPAEDAGTPVDGIGSALDGVQTQTALEKTRRFLEEHYGIDRWVEEELALLRGI